MAKVENKKLFAKKKKEGDVEEARNYRHICTLPALQKMFSKQSIQQPLFQA